MASVAADASCAVTGSAVGKSSGKSAKGPVDASSRLSDMLSMLLSYRGEDEAEGVDEGFDDRETAFEHEGEDEHDEPESLAETIDDDGDDDVAYGDDAGSAVGIDDAGSAVGIAGSAVVVNISDDDATSADSRAGASDGEEARSARGTEAGQSSARGTEAGRSANSERQQRHRDKKKQMTQNQRLWFSQENRRRKSINQRMQAQMNAANAAGWCRTTDHLFPSKGRGKKGRRSSLVAPAPPPGQGGWRRWTNEAFCRSAFAPVNTAARL